MWAQVRAVGGRMGYLRLHLVQSCAVRAAASTLDADALGLVRQL